MQAKDVRAVENPITAIFDLAEDVERQSPKLERLLRYTRIFVWIGLVLDFLLIVAFSEYPALAFFFALALFALLLLRGGVTDVTANGVLLAGAIAIAVFLSLTFGRALLFGVVFVALFYLGMVILHLLWDARSFLGYYALRHRVIRAVREADPVVLVPQGATPVDRLLTALGQRSAAVAGMLANPQYVRAPAILTGRSGVAYQLDAFLSWPAGTLAPLGVWAAGSAVYVKAFEAPPTRADLEALRRAVEDISQATRLPPGRVISLWKSDGKAEIPDETYAFLTSEVVRVPMRGRTFACSLELVTEMPDGTYDFIPFLMDPVPPTPAGAPSARPA